MLPRALRLRKNRDFQATYNRRQSWSTDFLTLFIRQRGLQTECSRVGVVVSKKVAKRAHDRNRIKRRLTEICRIHWLPRLSSEENIDLLFVARSSAPQASYAQLLDESETLVRRAGLLREAAPAEM